MFLHIIGPEILLLFLCFPLGFCTSVGLELEVCTRVCVHVFVYVCVCVCVCPCAVATFSPSSALLGHSPLPGPPKTELHSEMKPPGTLGTILVSPSLPGGDLIDTSTHTRPLIANNAVKPIGQSKRRAFTRVAGRA